MAVRLRRGFGTGASARGGGSSPGRPNPPPGKAHERLSLFTHDFARRLTRCRRINPGRDMAGSIAVRSRKEECEVDPVVFDEVSRGAWHSSASEDWAGFEPVSTCGNARLSHALILSGPWMPHAEAREIGLKSLRWLCDIQTEPAGHLRPIGSNGFNVRGGHRSEFDQQPIEAHATLSACLEAHRATKDSAWSVEAQRAFEWFLGRNDLGLPLYDSATGGLRDRLPHHRTQ